MLRRGHDERRAIDVVVLHHTSAINWFDPDFQFLLPQEVKDQVRSRGITPSNIRDHCFDLDLNIQLFRTYGVAPHYLIGRQGEVIQLVEDNDMAYHAGVSTMPCGDGRTAVNYFSIGIELTSIQTMTSASAPIRSQPTPKPNTGLCSSYWPSSNPASQLPKS